MAGWSECTLGDIVTLQRGHDLSETSRSSGNIPVIGSFGITGWHNEAKAQSPVLTIGRSGASFGTVFFYVNKAWPLNTCLYVTDYKNNHQKFLYYYFKNIDFTGFNSGSAQASLNRNILYPMTCHVPTISEQQAIAAVLSSLDDKIDLLHRQNKTLENMAQTLFRQWFVEEADGRKVCLADICHVITKGTTPTFIGKSFVECGVNFIKAESISDDSIFLQTKFANIEKETHEQLKRSILKEGDVLLTIAGTIGRVAIVENDILPANTNQAVAILRPNNQFISPEMLYLFLKTDAVKEVIDGKVIHAVQPNLSLGGIASIKVLLPEQNKLSQYTTMLYPIFKKKYKNQTQIHILTKLRDTLLPKLMSGEVRVEV